MSLLSSQPAGVTIQEVALGTAIAQNSTVTAAQVVISDRGPTVPTFYSTFDDYTSDFGPLRSSISFDGYTAKDFFNDGNSLWAVRAVSSSTADADRPKYGIINIGIGDTSADVPEGLNFYQSESADPESETFDISPDAGSKWPENTFGALGLPLYTFYYKKGPGSNSSNIALRFESKNLEATSFINRTIITTSGSLAGSASYRYRIAAFNDEGQVYAVASKTVAISATTNTNSIALQWDPVLGAAGYIIYGRSPTSQNYALTVVGGGTVTWTDDGSAVEDTTGALFPNYRHDYTTAWQDSTLPINYKFVIKVYDLNSSTVTPVETWPCSIIEQLDEYSVNMETSIRINTYSKYIKCVSNVPSYSNTNILRLYSSTTYTPNTTGTSYKYITLGAGQSGAAPTTADVNAAWDVFLDKEQYTIDVMINSGRAVPSVHKEMDYVASTRADCVAFLDSPSLAQDAQSVIDFRNLYQNINSSYSCLFASDLQEEDKTNGKVLYVPPSGAIAGLLARASRTSYPYRAIAGLNRGLLNALGVRNQYTLGDQQRLVTAQVNYVRKFIGKGMPLWEQFTLSSAPNALKFLNVRVLCNVLKRSMYDYLLYSVYEPGDEILRKQIKYGLEQYLDFVQGTRGLTSYQVICDSSINPSSVVNTGQLNVAVIIVPTLAVRAIQLTLIVSEQGLSLSESEITALAT